MGQIVGVCSLNPSKYKFYIDWTEDQVDPVANTSRVRAWVYVKRIADYRAEGSDVGVTLSIAGTTFFGNPYVDMNPETDPVLIVSGTKIVTHNSDGSKSISITASGDIPYGAGYGPDFGTAGATVALTTIPREATVSNSVSFTIEDNIPLTISNPANFWVKAELYVNGTLIRTQNLGQVTSATLTPTSGENDAMYAEIPNATSCAMFVRLKTYSDSGYTTQVGNNKDKTGTASIDQDANKPTFTTVAFQNVDKSVAVVDKYGNTLITSSTETLMNASDRMISGYSKVRATVAEANQAVPLNAATMDRYRFVCGLLQVEADFQPTGDVDLDIDNALVNAFTVTAFDSRNLATAVAGALNQMAEFTPITIFGMSLSRDNNVDEATKLVFSGQLWKKYFGSNSTTDDGSVLNAAVVEYRWKRSNHAWEALDGEFTITIASPGRVTKTAHGFETGDQVWFTTTGALPTGLSVETVYWVIKDDADHFWLATSLANAETGTKIDTSGTQSGVHTLYGDSMWATLAPTIDSAGVISFDDYVDGDLGATGFDVERSFDVEVRAFDKLSQVIVENTVAAGTPLMDMHQSGIAIKAKYNESEGGDLQLGGRDLAQLIVPVGGVLPFAGTSAPSGFLLCDGSAVSRTTYATLFALIGTTYGTGDGSTTFNIPNLKGKVPVGKDSGQTEFDNEGETGGAKTHTLITSEIPSHNHSWQIASDTGGAARAVGTAATDTTTLSTGNAGGGGAHNNLQPYIVLNYIIRF